MTLPVISILEEGTISSVGDFVRLGIVDWRRYHPHWNNSQHAIDIISSFFVRRTSYAILSTDLYAFPRQSLFPKWNRAGEDHRMLGEAFWNYFHATYEGELQFHDMPDFSGVIHHKDRQPQDWRFYGDIGQVSPVVMKEMTLQLCYYSLWMSIPNANTIIIVEPLIPITEEDPHTFLWQSLASEEYGTVIPRGSYG